MLNKDVKINIVKQSILQKEQELYISEINIKMLKATGQNMDAEKNKIRAFSLALDVLEKELESLESSE